MKIYAAKRATRLAWMPIALLLPLALGVSVDAAPTENGSEEVTVLPRYTVLSEILTITFSRSMGGVLTGAEVTWVAKDSAADKRGVQIYDELVSIDGVKIAGQNYTEMHDLLEKELKPGESIRLLFSGRRGALGRRLNYIFMIKRAEPGAAKTNPA